MALWGGGGWSGHYIGQAISWLDGGENSFSLGDIHETLKQK